MDLISVAGGECEGLRSPDIIFFGEPVIHMSHLHAVDEEFRDLHPAKFHGGDMTVREVEAVTGASLCQRIGDGTVPGDFIEVGEIPDGGNVVKFAIHGFKGLPGTESGIRSDG